MKRGKFGSKLSIRNCGRVEKRDLNGHLQLEL